MSDIAIQMDHLSKRYRLGVIGGKRLVDDVNQWWAKLRSKPDPLARIGSRTNANGVNNTRDTVLALDDISLDIKQGEVLGIIGRNGAGKSTLLKILSRVTAPTSGEARIKGRIASLLEVGTGFHPELTGRENIFLNGAILGMTKAEIRGNFDQIVSFSEVEQFIDTPVKRYSSGMYVRLAFGVAAHLEPEILVVDEVLAVGDAAFQKKCLGKMEDVARQGRTVLFVSHNMSAIQNLCQRVVLIDQGKLEKDGQARSVINAYLERIFDLTTSSLMDRTDRSGLGDILVSAIEFLSHQGNQIPHATSGEKLIIRLHYRSRSNQVFKNCRVSVSIHKDERVYFLMSTELVNKAQLDLKGNGFIDFIVPELPLSQGTYYLVPFVESNHVIQDYVVGAAKLSVTDGDFYGTGKNYPLGWQGASVLVKHTWRLGPSSS
jgi:homopolymeric O-antigen transport system ATP-binding protein